MIDLLLALEPYDALYGSFTTHYSLDSSLSFKRNIPIFNSIDTSHSVSLLMMIRLYDKILHGLHHGLLHGQSIHLVQKEEVSPTQELLVKIKDTFFTTRSTQVPLKYLAKTL